MLQNMITWRVGGVLFQWVNKNMVSYQIFLIDILICFAQYSKSLNRKSKIAVQTQIIMYLKLFGKLIFFYNKSNNFWFKMNKNYLPSNWNT